MGSVSLVSLINNNSGIDFTENARPAAAHAFTIASEVASLLRALGSSGGLWSKAVIRALTVNINQLPVLICRLKATEVQLSSFEVKNLAMAMGSIRVLGGGFVDLDIGASVKVRFRNSSKAGSAGDLGESYLVQDGVIVE